MSSPRDFYREIHPGYFSDSNPVVETELDRTLLEYHLDTITSRNQEPDFERFGRLVCEKAVCPNLMPSTGPTGGGDGKTDSETYPVAENLALAWFTGIDEGASRERWAFAFSAMKKWETKLESDVEKIVATGRGYTRAYFVTNQVVSSRKRSKKQDELSKQHGIDVRIFDRTWILEQVFSRRLEAMAAAELRISGLSRETVRVGPRDASRTANLEALEERIREGLAKEHPGPSVVDDAIEAADEIRSLERSPAEVKEAYDRADRLALKFGTERQQVEAAYQWAWTLCMYLGDVDGLAKQYEVVESRATDSDNVYDLEQLSNLLQVLGRHYILLSADDEKHKWYEERVRRLRASLERIEADKDRPSVSLQAQSLLIFMDLPGHFAFGTDPTPTFEAIRTIVPKIEHLVGFPFEPLVKLLTFLGEVFEDNESYNILFDQVIAAASKRDGEIRAARLLVQRAMQLAKKERPVKAIAKAGQALLMLYKHETRSEMGQALFLCGTMYDRIGLLWAARGCYLRAAALSVDELSTTAKLPPSLMLCVHKLKMLELRLGRLPHFLAWHQLDGPMRKDLAARGMDLTYMDHDDEVVEVATGRLMIRTPWEDLPKVTALPDVLNGAGLYAAAVGLLYLFGDVQPLFEAAKEMDVEEFANGMWNLEAEVPLPARPALYAADSTEQLTTNILGANVVFTAETKHPCIEVTETVFAIMESLLATSAVERAMVFEPELTGEVVVDETLTEPMVFTVEERVGTPHIVVRTQAFDPHSLSIEEQQKLGKIVFEAAVASFTQIVQFRDPDNDIEAIFGEERAGDRATFAASLTALRQVLGPRPKLRLGDWIVEEATVHPIVRSSPWVPIPREKEAIIPTMGEGEPPEGFLDPAALAHTQMAVVSPIRPRLWQRADWKAVLFVWEHTHTEPPILALWFGNAEAGATIFQKWLESGELGPDFKKLRVSIIRGISKKNPFHYRVLIGSNISAYPSGARLVQAGMQPITMTPDSPANLENFLREYEARGRAFLMPAVTGEGGRPEPLFDLGFPLHEVIVRNAWEIRRNDVDSMGVQPGDDINIPDHVESAPVLELLRWREERDSTLSDGED